MPQRPITPGGVELFGSYSKHLGPRFSGAGLGIQFRYNAPTGIHFETEVPEEFRDDIIRGVQDAMAIRFPDFPASGSIWITRVEVHPVESSAMAFYLAARMVIDQAFSLIQSAND